MVITGLSEYFGSCITIAMRLPRISRHCRCVEASRLWPWKASLSAVTLPGVRPRMARAGLRLAGAGFADDAELLAPHGEADVAHRMHVAGRRVEADVSFSTSRSGCPSCQLIPGIQHVAQPVADQVEAEADDEDGDAGIGADPPLLEDLAAAVGRPWRPIPAAAARRRGRGSRGPAAVRITPAMSSVTRTISEGMHIGMMWPSRMRRPEAPLIRAAAM